MYENKISTLYLQNISIAMHIRYIYFHWLFDMIQLSFEYVIYTNIVLLYHLNQLSWLIRNSHPILLMCLIL